MQNIKVAVYGLPFSGRKSLADALEHEVGTGAFSEPAEGGCRIAASPSDLEGIDAVLYMDPPAREIRGRMAGSEYGGLSEEQVDVWKEAEVLAMRNLCFDIGTDFILLNGTSEQNLGFSKALLSGKLLTPKRYAARIADDIEERARGRRVFLTDCDGTLSYDDTTDLLKDRVGSVSRTDLFARDRHTLFQAVMSLTAFEQPDGFMEAVEQVAGGVRLSPLIDDLKQLEDTAVFGITAGSGDIWDLVAKRIGFPEKVYGKRYRDTGLFVSGDVKGWTARLIRQKGIPVFAAGDSPVDYRMLIEADRGYVAAFRKKNPRLGEYLESGKRLTQPEYSEYLFDTTRRTPSVHEDLP